MDNNIYASPLRELSTLVGKFAGYHITWNSIVLHKNWALPVANNVYVKRNTKKIPSLTLRMTMVLG